MTPSCETSSTRPRTRLSPQERRQAILAAARRCCVRNGAFDLSLADVAQEAGISRNLVYHYFKNHESLLEALLVAEGEILAARAAEIKPLTGEAPRETLRRLICAFLDFTAEALTVFHCFIMHQTSNRFCGNGLTHLPAFFRVGFSIC